MPILFVNGKRRGLRIRGSARVNPAKTLRYAGAAGGGVGKTVPIVRRTAATSGSGPRPKRRKHTVKRGRRARGSMSMAKQKKARRRGQPAALKRYWAARKRAGKEGRPGKTRRSSAARRRAALKGIRRAKARKQVAHKTRRRARRATHRTKSRRTRARKRTRARTRRTTRRRRRRSSKVSLTVMSPHLAKTIKMNPGRRRRRRSHRRGRRARRRTRRTSYRRYRRNPGNMLLDLAKRAVPLLVSFYGSKMLSARLAPMVPGLSSLGSLAGPLTSVGVLFGANFATKKVGLLARHKSEIMLGAAGAVVESLIQAFAPPSVKALVGMSDYIQMGDYVAVGGAPPIDDSMTLADYIAVGNDGVEEELGLEEELGVEEELGNDLLGGVSSTSLMKRVPTQNFLAPVPARSFTKVIPPAGSTYDNPRDIYGGIFGGGFGR